MSIRKEVARGMEFPGWLEIIAWISLGVAGLCTLVVLFDIVSGHRQHMWIMNLVWPITMLFVSIPGLVAYFKWGRLSSHHAMHAAKERGEPSPAQQKPFWTKVSIAALHCGSGCTLGDLIVEWGVLLFPFTLFGKHVFGTWVADYIAAFLLGIMFQYFTIQPMKQLSIGEGLVAALKADTLSLTAWQLGMYGWMAIAIFGIFGHELPKTSPVFWFMMQIAMLFGFGTSFPVNHWLLKRGVKESM